MGTAILCGGVFLVTAFTGLAAGAGFRASVLLGAVLAGATWCLVGIVTG